ncbi:hypothetical protein [Spiroplasma endosymbiont of Amphibalanus improvisus]|uniref:hypothetical protein n=1 Tax=Spiroplasma endosymbiont of Amphibalanus improvisus TaxID=3066327 RepID=UPI00313F2338
MAYNNQNKVKAFLTEKHIYNSNKNYNSSDINIFTNDDNQKNRVSKEETRYKFNKYNFQNNSTIQNQLKLNKNYKIINLKVNDVEYETRQYTNISTLTNIQKLKIEKMLSVEKNDTEYNELKDNGDFDFNPEINDNVISKAVYDNLSEVLSNDCITEKSNLNYSEKLERDEVQERVMEIASNYVDIEQNNSKNQTEETPKSLVSIINKAKELNAKTKNHNFFDIENLTIQQRIELRNLAIKNPEDPLYRKLLTHKLSLAGTFPNLRKEIDKRKKQLIEQNSKISNKNNC